MPEIRQMSEFALIGIKTSTSNQDEMSGSNARIPGLWNDYFRKGVSSRIPNKLSGGSTFAVYTDYESDHNGRYSLVLGEPVSSLQEIPDGMVGITVPAASYLVFSAEGPVPESIVTAWGEIWSYFQGNQKETRAYSSDFELYRSDANDGAEIFIAIK